MKNSICMLIIKCVRGDIECLLAHSKAKYKIITLDDTGTDHGMRQRRIQDFWKGGSNNYIHKRGWVLEGACPLP